MIWAILVGILLPVAFIVMPKTMSWLAHIYMPGNYRRHGRYR